MIGQFICLKIKQRANRIIQFIFRHSEWVLDNKNYKYMQREKIRPIRKADE